MTCQGQPVASALVVSHCTPLQTHSLADGSFGLALEKECDVNGLCDLQAFSPSQASRPATFSCRAPAPINLSLEMGRIDLLVVDARTGAPADDALVLLGEPEDQVVYDGPSRGMGLLHSFGHGRHAMPAFRPSDEYSFHVSGASVLTTRRRVRAKPGLTEVRIAVEHGFDPTATVHFPKGVSFEGAELVFTHPDGQRWTVSTDGLGFFSCPARIGGRGLCGGALPPAIYQLLVTSPGFAPLRTTIDGHAGARMPDLTLTPLRR